MLILSHGQSSVERGFNVNKDVAKVNLQEKSVISRKMIIDHMQKNNVSPSTIEITRKLARSVKAACQKYHLDLEEQKKNAKKNECNEQLKILTAEIKDAMQKKNILLEVCQKLDKEFVDIVKDAEKKNDMGLIVNANALKRKSVEKRLEISTFDKAIEAIEAKRKSCCDRTRPLPVFLWGGFFDRVTFLKMIGLLCFSLVFCLLHFVVLLHCFTCLF